VPVVDSALLSRVVDGVLIVVSANKTPRKLLEEALNELDSSKVVGIVFNNDARPLYGYDNNYRRYFSQKH
jgi:Mrp family chromosome partitioning ATPase